MATEGNPSNNNTEELKKYETRKVVLTEKSEELFNEIEEISNRIYEMKMKIEEDAGNGKLEKEVSKLIKKESELREVFDENNQEIQNLNEMIFAKKVSSVHANKKDVDENDEEANAELNDTLDDLLAQNSQSKKQDSKKGYDISEPTLSKLYDSEDDLPAVKELAENYRKKAEETINTTTGQLIREPEEVDADDISKESDPAIKVENDISKGETIKVPEISEDEDDADVDAEKETDLDVMRDIQEVLEEHTGNVQDTSDLKIPIPKAIDEDVEPDKKSTEKFLTETPRTATTKAISPNEESNGLNDSEMRLAAVAELSEIQPVSLEAMIKLLRKFNEKLVNLARSSLEKNVKVSSAHFNSIVANIQTVENYIQEIANRMNKFQLHLNKLTEAFNKRFLEDKVKDQAFNKLYESMQDYKEDFLKSAKKPIFLDLIRLYDDIQKMLTLETNKNLELISDVIIEILYRNDIEVIGEAPENFDRTFQKAVKRIDTDDESKDRKVAEIMKIGFTQGSQIIRPQEVSVYIYKEMD